MGIPLLDQVSEFDSASLRVSAFGRDYEATISTSWTVPLAQAEARAQFDAAVASSPYTVDTTYDASDTSVYLVGGDFSSIRASLNEGYPAESATYLSVSGTFDLQL